MRQRCNDHFAAHGSTMSCPDNTRSSARSRSPLRGLPCRQLTRRCATKPVVSSQCASKNTCSLRTPLGSRTTTFRCLIAPLVATCAVCAAGTSRTRRTSTAGAGCSCTALASPAVLPPASCASPADASSACAVAASPVAGGCAPHCSPCTLPLTERPSLRPCSTSCSALLTAALALSAVSCADAPFARDCAEGCSRSFGAASPRTAPSPACS
jgi:hypothetical protein